MRRGCSACTIATTPGAATRAEGTVTRSTICGGDDTHRSVCRRALFLLSLAVMAVGGSAGAELVVLAEGSVIKVESHTLQNDRVELHLPGGGTLELSLMRVERIVADEIEDADVDAFVLEDGGIEIAFAESHGVPDTPYGNLIYEAARRYDINPGLVAAMVRAESAFDPRAVSSKGASGLLQLMPATASRFGLEPSGLFDPARNLEAGLRYLTWLRHRFDGDTALVLAAYNAGEVNVDRYGGIPPFRETQAYVRRIYDWLGVDSAIAGAR